MPGVQEQEIANATTVHAFFVELFAYQLGHDIPLPQGLDANGMVTSDEKSLRTLRYWLDVLDLGLTPGLLRDGLGAAGAEQARALLLYYYSKRVRTAADRDKADFIVTWLFRHPQQAGGWASVNTFERHLVEVVGPSPFELPVEHVQLVREFDFIREEVEDTRHFDTLMDSGVIQRVRDIKAAFGESFYHTTVLATVASYNVHFGNKFDELFRLATKEIKEFAQRVQEQGGSSMARIQGDLTVKQLEEVDESLSKKEYREAQDEFRQVSMMKKAIDNKRKETRTGSAPVAPRVAAQAPPQQVVIRTADEANSIHIGASKTAAHSAAQPMAAASESAIKSEEIKIRAMADTIRAFVRAADPARANIVPMRHGNVVLSPAEIDAYRADFGMEKSFRSDFASTLVGLVACGARIDAELADYKAKQGSAYLWKTHADALAHLLHIAQELRPPAQQLQDTARQRGLVEKMNALTTTLSKLNDRTKLATITLSALTGPRAYVDGM